MPKSFQIKKHGVKTSAKWTPIQSVGLYIPGGLAILSFFINYECYSC